MDKPNSSSHLRYCMQGNEGSAGYQITVGICNLRKHVCEQVNVNQKANKNRKEYTLLVYKVP